MKIGKEKREFLIPLTGEELHYRAAQAAELSEKAVRIKDEASKLTAEASRCDKEAKRLLQVFRAQEESRDVECDLMFSNALQEVTIVRRDTGEVVDRRKPTPEDWRNIEEARQQEISFEMTAPVRATRGRRPTLRVADAPETPASTDTTGAEQ